MDNKVWVEAERSKDGSTAILTLKSVIDRREVARSHGGEHAAHLPVNSLARLGFPERFMADLERGRPVRFRMNRDAFIGMVGKGGGLGYFEPEEDDEDGGFEPDLSTEAVITPTGRLGSQVGASFEGRHVGVFRNEREAVKALREKAERSNYFPNLYWVDDHGGITLLSWEDYR